MVDFPTLGPRKAKKCLRTCANVRILSILYMRRVSSGHSLVIKIFFTSKDSVCGQRRPGSACADAQLIRVFAIRVCPETRFRMARPFFSARETSYVLSCLRSYTPSEKGSSLKEKKQRTHSRTKIQVWVEYSEFL